MLANHITEQAICCITKTTRGEENINKCPGPEVECKHTLGSGENSVTGSLCMARIQESHRRSRGSHLGVLKGARRIHFSPNQRGQISVLRQSPVYFDSLRRSTLGPGHLFSSSLPLTVLVMQHMVLFCNLIGQHESQLESTSGHKKADQSHQITFRVISKWWPEVGWDETSVYWQPFYS